MANVALGNKAVGSIVKLKENGALVDYLVVHQGKPSSIYDASCDGVWLLRKDIAESRVWAPSHVNKLENSDIQTYLNGTWINRYDAAIQAAIKQVKIPYRQNGGSGGTDRTGANGLSCKIFLLSGYEVGWTTSTNQYFPVDGAVLSYFQGTADTDSKRIEYLNGRATPWWIRSPYTGNLSSVWRVYTDGKYSSCDATSSYGVRPALILPYNLLVSDDGTINTNTAPTTPVSINVPGSINGGSTITISWSAATDAEGNLEGYIVERSTDGGSIWVQIYQGGETSTTNTVPFGTESVMYRVKAYDAERLESGWKTSAQVTVINNTAPTVPGNLTVPEAVQGGQPLVIAWSASTDGENNLAGYNLERQVDGGAWETVYSGPELSFADQITKGWQTVAYRVRAYDTVNAYSSFAVSEAREVNNNTPPAITCDQPYGTNLGVKSEGFAVDYSVADEEEDAVIVTEAVDGTTLRTFAVELGAENSFTLDGEAFMKLLNGQHALDITASDDKASTVHKLTFTKEVTSASVTLAQPMEADGPISVCVLSVSGYIPLDAEYMVEVTNNANDDESVWEDCTAAVRAGVNHVFENEDAANGFAFNFRLHASRGESSLGGYIASVQGGFQ